MNTIGHYHNKYNESSLSRIKSKFDNHTVGAITAFRGTFTKKENMQRNKKLLAQLLRAGYQVTTVKGSYIEDYGTEKAKEVGETSFIVVNPTQGDDGGKLEKYLIERGKEYDQDSILSVRYKQPAELIGTNRGGWPGMGVRVPVGKAKYGKAGEFFSRIRGRTFNFSEGEHKLPDTRLGKLALKIIAEGDWKDVIV